MTTRKITRADLQQRLALKAPLVLVEALPAPYFQKGHLPTALNLPHDQTRRLAPALLPQKDAEIVVYCASPTCRNSEIAATALTGLGYQNVSVFAGGKQEWEEAGLPFEVS